MMNVNVQSCSIDVPGGCPFNCKCCISEINMKKKFMINKFTDFVNHKNTTMTIDSLTPFFKEYYDRLAYIREKTDTLVLTGTASDPICHKDFLEFFHKVNSNLLSPFYNIEIQTAGPGLNKDKLIFLKSIGVKTIALSLFSCNSKLNNEIQRAPEQFKYDIIEICKLIKDVEFNLRLCFNLNKEGFSESEDPINIIDFAYNNKADQITFRKLYHNNTDNPQTQWVKENQLSENYFFNLQSFIVKNGVHKRTLDYGAELYTINGMSIAIDMDSMGKENEQALKYLILRRNFKIYTDWDDDGSLLF
jgi:hypothetical protein